MARTLVRTSGPAAPRGTILQAWRIEIRTLGEWCATDNLAKVFCCAQDYFGPKTKLLLMADSGVRKLGDVARGGAKATLPL
jgi:hypothetical protein